MSKILINEKGVQVHFHVGNFHYDRELRHTGSGDFVADKASGVLGIEKNGNSGGESLRRARSRPLAKYNLKKIWFLVRKR